MFEASYLIRYIAHNTRSFNSCSLVPRIEENVNSYVLKYFWWVLGVDENAQKFDFSHFHPNFAIQ